MDGEQASGIELKLTYNRDKRMPRNFFIHLFNVPQDATVQIVYDGQDIAVSAHSKGKVDARFWVTEDEIVQITIRENDTVLTSGSYLIHEGFFHILPTDYPSITILQLVYMS